MDGSVTKSGEDDEWFGEVLFKIEESICLSPRAKISDG